MCLFLDKPTPLQEHCKCNRRSWSDTSGTANLFGLRVKAIGAWSKLIFTTKDEFNKTKYG
jgi:hypothetical protein